MKRYALLSMDVEDWYHLEYFAGRTAGDGGRSMLDGVDRFRATLADEGVPATFFTLGDLGTRMGAELRALRGEGHEIASHGPDHTLLSRMSTADFMASMRGHKAALEDAAGAAVEGYRAPCFSMDREKLETLPGLGFRYDSSWIRFASHPLYGSMELPGWDELVPGVHRAPGADFLEFEIPTARTRAGRVPVSGGAYFRLFPWMVTRRLLAAFLPTAAVYVFYIHPFECSAVRSVPYPAGTGLSTRVRFQAGRSHTLPRLRRLIRTLRGAGFSFTTFGTAARAFTA
jgi:polysaccharide deacetylase family protein (PEP-CTERM system associated)